MSPYAGAKDHWLGFEQGAGIQAASTRLRLRNLAIWARALTAAELAAPVRGRWGSARSYSPHVAHPVARRLFTRSITQGIDGGNTLKLGYFLLFCDRSSILIIDPIVCVLTSSRVIDSAPARPRAWRLHCRRTTTSGGCGRSTGRQLALPGRDCYGE